MIGNIFCIFKSRVINKSSVCFACCCDELCCRPHYATFRKSYHVIGRFISKSLRPYNFCDGLLDDLPLYLGFRYINLSLRKKAPLNYTVGISSIAREEGKGAGAVMGTAALFTSAATFSVTVAATPLFF